MRRILTILTLLVTIAVAASIIAAIRGKTLDPDTFYFVASEPKTIDPQKTSWMFEIRICELLWEPLLRLSPDQQLEPAAAEKWEISPDGKTYTFHIRPSAKWSDGDDLTADDFIYAWRRAILPERSFDYTEAFFCIKGAKDWFDWRNAQTSDKSHPWKGRPEALWAESEKKFTELVGLSAPDPKTLVVQLAQPTSYFLELCAFAPFMPVHAKSIHRFTTFNPETGELDQKPEWTDPQNVVCNGPYILKARRLNEYLKFEVNPHFWNKSSVVMPKITQICSEDAQAQMTIYKNREVDWYPDPDSASVIAADLVAQQAAGKRNDVHLFIAAGTYFYNFNCLDTYPGPDGKPIPNPLTNQKLRLALSHAIDRKTIVEKVTRLNQPIAKAFTPPGSIPGYETPESAGIDYNPELARQLLKEAGYPGGAGLRGLSIITNSNPGHEAIAAAIKDTWEKELGVIVSIETLPQSLFRERLKKQQYTIARGNWFGDYRDTTTFLNKMKTGDGNNDNKYSNPQFDALLAASENQRDPAKRFKMLADAEAMMLADQPIAFIYYYRNLTLFNPDQVAGLIPNPWLRYRLDRVKVDRSKK